MASKTAKPAPAGARKPVSEADRVGTAIDQDIIAKATALQAERLHLRFGFSYPVAYVVASLAYAGSAR